MVRTSQQRRRLSSGDQHEAHGMVLRSRGQPSLLPRRFANDSAATASQHSASIRRRVTMTDPVTSRHDARSTFASACRRQTMTAGCSTSTIVDVKATSTRLSTAVRTRTDDGHSTRSIAAGLRTSPASMSPSSLFDYEGEEDGDEADYGLEGVRGWLSETTKELRNPEIPSSRSPLKRKAMTMGVPMARGPFRLWRERVQQPPARRIMGEDEVGKAEDEEGADDDVDSVLTQSPLLRKSQSQGQQPSVLRHTRAEGRSTTGSSRDDLLPVQVPSELTPPSPTCTSLNKSILTRKSTPFLSEPRQGASSAESSNASKRGSLILAPARTESIKRRHTPFLGAQYSRSPLSPLVGRTAPARPQSAMKHRSANAYSSGKSVLTILVTRGSLPRSGSTINDDDDDVSPATILGRQSPPRLKRATIDEVSDCEGPFAASPPPHKPFSPSSSKMTKGTKRGRYALRARASLPENSFYARTKREESSPSPCVRRRMSSGG